MEVTIFVTALGLGLEGSGGLEPVRLRFGFGLPSALEGRLATLIVSTFLVDGPSLWLRETLLLLWTLRVYEWVAGTRRALVLYWSTNLLASLLTVLLVV